MTIVARTPEQLAALRERESLAYAAARRLVGRVWHCQKDRPEAAVKTLLATLQRWSADCDGLATGDAPAAPLALPAPGAEYRVRLTPAGAAALEAAEAAEAAAELAWDAEVNR